MQKEAKLTDDSLVVVKYREKEEEKDKKEKNFDFSYLTPVTDIGFSLSIPTVGGAILGRYLDDKLFTFPKLTLSFILLGLLIGIVNIFRTIKNIK